MVWWGWALTAWVSLAAVAALWCGAALRTADRLDRRRTARHDDRR